MSDHNYVVGFLKRAQECGLNQISAVNLLKFALDEGASSLSLPVANNPVMENVFDLLPHISDSPAPRSKTIKAPGAPNSPLTPKSTVIPASISAPSIAVSANQKVNKLTTPWTALAPVNLPSVLPPGEREKIIGKIEAWGGDVKNQTQAKPVAPVGPVGPVAQKQAPAPKIDPKKQRGTRVSPVPYERDTSLTTPPATKEERDRIIKEFQSMGLNIKIEE